MANYYLNNDGTVTKNNKKKKKGTNYILQKDGTVKPEVTTPKTTTKKEDIAPVKKEKKNSWFNSGAFSDGYDFGDITKTILGTNKDVSENLSAGVARIAEGVIDLAPMAIGGVANMMGKDNLADKMKNFQKRNLVEEYGIDKKISESLPGGQALKFGNALINKGDAESNSVFGSKSQNLIQSAAQMGGTIGLQMVGVPWWATTGVTAFSAGAEEAFNNDATYGEAATYGAISAGAEVLTEKIGGIKFGGKALLDPVKKQLATAITKKSASTLARFGIDAAAEGGEEVLSEIIQNVGKKLTYEDEETWKKLLVSEDAMEGYLDAFIGGAVMGGGFSSGKVYNSIKTGRDYDTGLSDNEQKVIDSEIKNRTAEKQKKAAVKSRIDAVISEREKTFGTLTEAEKKNIRQQVQSQLDNGELDYTTAKLDKKEIATIEKQVREDLDRGYIGIDTIENTLAGEKTAQIKDLTAELSKTTNEEKKAEIQAKIDQLTVDRATQMQAMLKNDIYLQESYRQEALKKEEFDVQPTEKDSDITKELIESAKSVKMNNTRKMHEVFDFTNKIANDTKTRYGFTNNAQLKELGYEVEGASINGLVRVEKDGSSKVLINVDSQKALDTIIGHETTHLLEGTNEYKALQDIVKQYATTKGEYDTRLKIMQKLYEGTNANIENEITADLVGDYLFSDAQFVNEISANRNVFQRVYDFIKHAYKMATAGSQEARQLEQVKRRFDAAYRQMSKATIRETETNLTTEADSNTRFSLNTDFAREVDSWYVNKSEFNKKGGQFNVGSTSEALKSIGVKDQNIVWDKSKVKKILNDHPEMTIDIIKDVPNIIENPVLVMQSKTRVDSITLFGEVYSNGNPVLVAMQLSPTGKSGRILNLSKIASAYGRNNAQSLIDSSDILYVDSNKKRTDTWLRALGLQLPVSLTTYGPIGRVTYYSDIVNSKKEKGITAFEEALLKAQNKKESASNDKDIRFSLSEPVEQGKELIAVHNMRSSELMKTLDLGGFPMPSIAVIKAQSGHNEYGDVSIVFGKDTIDPKFFRSNKVYGGDAWTPTYPTIEYKVNPKVERKISELYYELSGKYGYDEVRPLYNYAENLEDQLNRNNGAAGMIENLQDDTGMMQIYLMASGKGKVENVTKETVTEMSEAETEQSEYLIKALGEDVVRSINPPEGVRLGDYRRQWISEHKVELETAYSNLLSELYGFNPEQIENVLNSTKTLDYFRMINSAVRYLNGDTRDVKTEIDYQATKEKIIEKSADGYSDWLNDLFSGVEEKSGIRNNAEPFTRSGNRRSWEALHWENNLENVVKVMKQGENGTGFFGGSGIYGVSAKEYKSIDEIRADSGRLEKMDEEQYSKIKDELGQRFSEIANSIMDKSNSNHFIAVDNAMECIVDAVRKSKTKSGIMNELKQYRQLTVTEQNVDDIVSLVTDIANMPTEYFEAKPQRAVGLDEIEAVIIPDDADAALISRLQEGGYNVIQYEAGNAEDRAAKLNALDDQKFSLSNPGEIAPYGRIYGNDVKLHGDEIAPVAAVTGEAAAPADEIAPVVIPEEKRYEGGRPLTEADMPYVEQERDEAFANLPDDYAPMEAEEAYNIPDTSPIDDKSMKMLSRNMKSELGLKNKQVSTLEKIIQDFSTSEDESRDSLYEKIENEFGTIYETSKIDDVVQIKRDLRSMRIKVSDTIKGDIPDYFQFKQKNFGKIRFSNDGLPVDDVYEGLKALYPEYFPDDIINPTDQLFKMVEVANLDSVYTEEYFLPEEQIQDVTDFIYESVHDYKREMAMKASHKAGMLPIDESMIPYEPKVERVLPPSDFDPNDFTESIGIQQEYDSETEEIVESEKDIELEKLERRKKKALDELGDLPTYTSRKAKELYEEVRSMQKGVKVSSDLGYILDHMFEGVDKNAEGFKERQAAIYKDIRDTLLRIVAKPEKATYKASETDDFIRNVIKTRHEWAVRDINAMTLDTRAKAKQQLRKELLGGNPELFAKALDDAKNIPMALMNNTDTIRNTELVFGRKNAEIINREIFQKEIDNEARSIAWQNKERESIKALGIKARSKESAAVQKWGEGEFVNEFGDIEKYDDDALAAEFSDYETQQKIRTAARAIKEKYEEYIDLANGVLTKLGFDPINKRKDYMRHFQELNDVFSRYGIPFNAQAMQEHVLPTDINGLTEFWSPQKNYFANMQPRKGMRTIYDAITGIDGYISGISNLIYHTEDIQRGRAFEDLIRETYGQESGWDNLEKMEGLSPEEYQARADKIQDNHLSNYAAWVHEWTNNIAGKKNKIDRSVEAMFGRKIFSALDQTRKQIGSNMIGFNLSSSLTNLIAPVQAMAKTNKLAVAKGTADTIKNIFVKDNFMEKNNFLTARMGTDMLSKNPWQKVQDAGFIFMKGLDWFSSNQIVRSKYYELRAKGIEEEKAHEEAGKFAARILGDRTKGANAQLYNSKLVGIVTQFQLEVNNQLYSMFYDTYHESKENAKGNAARLAAGMTFTLGQLFGFTHLFGKTFEAIAGYNPTFDIIGILMTAFGAGDDDDEKTTSERLKDAADKLVDALPYVNIITGGGRIPIASGIPNLVGVATGGKDQYGNEMTLKDEMKKLLYLLPPTGGNQIKKTTQGLGMFDKDNPVPGSYTDNGNLRFPVEDTPINRIQSGLFGQWANENAGKYFDQERLPLKEKQIQEYKELDIPIADYWEYRDGLKKQKKLEDKFDYIAGLDLPVSKKNIMINNIVDRKEKVDLINYDDFGSYEEFDFSVKNPEKYQFMQENHISYKSYNATEESREAYNWAFNNPEGYAISKAVASDVVQYRRYSEVLNDIKADKDEAGKSISGSRKEKVANYINSLDADYGSKLILFKKEYPSEDDYNYEIIDYLNNRQDISYAEMQTILIKLGFQVDASGNITW